DPGPLAGDRQARPTLLGGKAIPQGGPVVVGPKDDLPAPRRLAPLAERDVDLFTVGDHPAAFARVLGIGLVDGPRLDALDRRVAAERGPVGQVDAQPRRPDDGPTSEREGIRG